MPTGLFQDINSSMQSPSDASGVGSPRSVTSERPDRARTIGNTLERRARKRRRTDSDFNQDTNVTVLSPSRSPPAEFATNAAYARWLDSIKQGYGTYVGRKVRATYDDKDYEGTVASIYHHATRSQSQWRQPAANSVHPSRARPFSIRWEDDTDSLWDLNDLEEGIARCDVGTCSSGNSRSRSRTGHRNEATAPPSGNNGAGRRNNPPPSPIVPPHVPAQQAGIFAGIHSVPGDIVDLMTRQGTFTFLERLNESGRLWSLRDFRISRLVPKGKARHDFAESMRLVLTLAQKYPDQSLPRYILRAVAQFLPALLMPSQRRGKASHVCSNAKKFQEGNWNPSGNRLYNREK